MPGRSHHKHHPANKRRRHSTHDRPETGQHRASLGWWQRSSEETYTLRRAAGQNRRPDPVVDRLSERLTQERQDRENAHALDSASAAFYAMETRIDLYLNRRSTGNPSYLLGQLQDAYNTYYGYAEQLNLLGSPQAGEIGVLYEQLSRRLSFLARHSVMVQSFQGHLLKLGRWSIENSSRSSSTSGCAEPGSIAAWKSEAVA